MAKTLTSELILRLRDRVSGPARGAARSMERLNERSERMNRSTRAMVGMSGRGVAALGAMAGAYLGVGIGAGSAVKGAMAMEDAMVDLEKVSNLSAGQLKAMQERATELSSTMPLAAAEIVKLMASASQFGIAADDLERFSLMAAKSAVAFDMDSSTAAENLSKLKNAYALPIDQLGLLADAINKTADTAGTSEASVIDFLLRTGATAKTFGASAQQMAAFGATLNEIGIESSRAGTGMNAMMNKMADLTGNKKAVAILDRFAGEGYSKRLQEEFFERPVEAMTSMFDMAQEMSKEQRAGFFKAMFGLEYGDDAAAITENIDTIQARLQGLSDTQSYAGSVGETYQKFADRTSSKLAILGNNFRNIGNAIGAAALPGIVEFTDKLSGTLATLDERVTIFDRVKASVGGFLDGLGADGERLQQMFDGVWNTIFGDPAQFENDTNALTASFQRFQEWGDNVREFASALGEMAASIDRFFGADPGTAVSVMGEMATTGLQLTLAAAGVSAMAGAIWKIGRAVMFLSGASAVIGGAKGIRNIFRAMRGGAAVAGGGAAGAAAGGGAAAGIAKFGAKRILPGAGLVMPNTLGDGTVPDGGYGPNVFDHADGERARGGPVWPGRWLVGEQGPELVDIAARGRVHSAFDTRRIMGGAGPVSLTFGDINILGGANASPRQIADELGRKVEGLLSSHFSDAGI